MPEHTIWKEGTWNEEEYVLLRQHYGKLPWPDLIRLLNRRKSQIANQAFLLQLNAGRQRDWTPDEDALMREHYGKMPLPDLMQLLDRRKCQIYQRAKKLQLTGERPSLLTETEISTIRDLNIAGKNDREIATTLGRSVITVRKVRHKLELPCHLHNETQQQRQQQSLTKYYKSAKFRKNLKHKFAGHRGLAEKYNLPSDLKLGQVIIIVTLAHQWLMTRAQLAQKLHIVPESISARYMPKLLKLGLVEYIPGGLRKCGWYKLSLKAMDLLTKVLEEPNHAHMHGK